MVATRLCSLLLASFAVAAPTIRSTSSCPTSEQFTLELDSAGYKAQPLKAVTSSSGLVYLIFENPELYKGTPTCLSEGRLLFAVSGSSDVLSAAYTSPGDLAGQANPINAISGAESGNATFSFANGFLDIQRTAALQELYACNTTVAAQQALGLYWGVEQQNGLPPAGCVPTNVEQNFNIKGGAQPPP